jgi:hypothetical protein
MKPRGCKAGSDPMAKLSHAHRITGTRLASFALAHPPRLSDSQSRSLASAVR